MQNEKTYFNDLLSLITTQEQANLMLSEIEELERASFKVDVNIFNETLNSKVRSTTANFINKNMAGKDKTSFFTELKDTISKLLSIELTIAFEPTNESLSKICDWARKNVNSAIILNIKKDKRILGGAVITYNGKFKDYSLVHEVDDHFKNI